MKIKTLWKLVGGLLLGGSCLSVALLFAQDSAPAPAAQPAAAQAPGPPAGRGGGGGGGGRSAVAWAPKATKPAGWIAPNKPIWRLSEILAAHRGQADWTE